MNTAFFEQRMTISVISTNDHRIVCYHARFVFVGTLKKAVTIPATKFCVIYSFEFCHEVLLQPVLLVRL